MFSRQCGLRLQRGYSTETPSPIISALKAHPPKIIPDYLTPMPSHLLTTTINDLLYPSPSSSIISSPPKILPQGHHLVYFPIQLPPSRLIPDGADPDHSPGLPYIRRVWAGGEVMFRGEEMKLDARPVVCREKIEDVNLRGREGEEKVFVDVWRKYGTGHEVEGRQEWDIEERRTLVFMREEKEPAELPTRLLKCEFLSIISAKNIVANITHQILTHQIIPSRSPHHQYISSISLRSHSTLTQFTSTLNLREK